MDRLPLIVTALIAGCAPTAGASDHDAAGRSTVPAVLAGTPEDAGRYLVRVGGCNDCHTDGYAESGGRTPESAWLTGSAVGMRGPWGTSYPSNLRESVHALDEDLWVASLRTRQGLPPMPWTSLNHMSDGDLRSLYRFIRSLGPGGDPSRPALAPSVEPGGAWIDFEPRQSPPAAVERMGVEG